MKIASPEWCAAVLEATKKDNEVHDGFADPPSFTYNVEFVILPDIKICAAVEKGRIVRVNKTTNEEIHLSFVADAGTWGSVISGKESASKMVTMGKIKVQKGPLDLVIKNVKALEAFCRKMGQIPTEWS
jgi:putative sterol carrier protein